MRKLTAFALFLFSCHFLQAQSNFSVKINAGLFRMSAYRVTPEYDYSIAKLSGSAGIGYDLNISDNFTVKPELNYSYQRSGAEAGNSIQNISYIQLPVLGSVKIANSNFRAFAGPQLGFLLSANREVSGVKQDLDNRFTQTDFGFTYGLATNPGTNHLFYDLRVYSGITNLYKAEYDMGAKTKPFMITLGVGYHF